MMYHSTRGQAPELSFADVVLTGLARDGGLYLPKTWPTVDVQTLQHWKTLSYAELATEVLSLFVGDDISNAELAAICEDAYAQFTHPAVAPLVQLEPNLWVAEHFHGPTLAFKDFAMQALGRLFDHLLAKRGEHRVIVGATSGDTGSAAIEAVKGLEHVSLYMLHPAGRVSEVQRRQMTTVDAPNIHNIAVDGNFDDCQNLVKALFNDLDFRDKHGLSAVNSINWARVAAQVVYYFHAALQLGAPENPVSFSVPSGNFGNVFAGFVARKMGLPISQFVVGSNRNDILTRFFVSGEMVGEEVIPSLSPSMDIQISSNFERLLFETCGQDAEQVRGWMEGFKQNGRFAISPEQHQNLLTLFSAYRLSDAETIEEMKRIYDETGYVIDPHSAIGVMAARATRFDLDTPMIVLATAHPAKFPDAVEEAIGVRPSLPSRCQHIMNANEHLEPLAASEADLKGKIDQDRG
ncbi:MAG: threonine synthase [Gammaproteobacteria bacterium]|nr:threonine synthase [Gammaproteobacteria bacterium]